MVPGGALLAEVKWALVVAALVGCYTWGRYDGGALEEATQLREARLIEDAGKAAQIGAAGAIAKQEVKHVTVQRRIERETREVPVYRDCRHSPDGLRALNNALESRSDSAGDRELPGNPGQPDGR